MRDAIENEIRALKAARPTTIKALADLRAARLCELEALLLAAPPSPIEADPVVEAMLRRSGGGDRIGRR